MRVTNLCDVTARHVHEHHGIQHGVVHMVNDTGFLVVDWAGCNAIQVAPPLALVNKVGAPRRAFSTFMTFPQSFAFHNLGPCMVWDDHTKTHTKPLVDKRKRTMWFCTGTTAALSFSEGQRRNLLGQAMDFNTMLYNIGLCLALQRHRGD